MSKIKSTDEHLKDAKEIIRKKNAEIVGINRALRATEREADTAEAIRTEIYRLSARSPEPPEWLMRSGHSHSRGAPVVMWGDWHYGETVSREEVGGVNEFNLKVAAARAKTLFEATIDICDNHMGSVKHKYPGIVICLGGDFMTGDIHEELAVTNDRTPQQAINDLTDHLATGIEIHATHFGRVFCPAVVGNHGRGTLRPRAKHRVYTSHEWNIYCNLERHFRKSKHVQFLVPAETDAHFTVYGHRFLLTHGDSLGVRGGDGIIGALGPIMRGAIKVGRSEAQIGRDFDTILMQHWHEKMEPPGIKVGGCLIGYNEYARIMLRARYQRPCQTLFFTHPEQELTATWPIYLEPKLKRDVSTEWTTWRTTGS